MSVLSSEMSAGSPNGPGPVCNYAIAPASHTLGPDGGTATVTVTASAEAVDEGSDVCQARGALRRYAAWRSSGS